MKKTARVMLACMLAITMTVLFQPAVFALADGAGTAYYVDSLNGNDDNSGLSESSPWRTASNMANIQWQTGDCIFFRCGGTYDCSQTIQGVCGTAENPVVISSYGEGEKPVLRTEASREVLTLIDCSYVTVSNLEITAPNGGGIWIDTLNEISEGITIDNVYFHGMPNGKVNSRDDFSRGAAAARAAVMVKGLPARSRYAVNDLTISNCEVFDCANGFMVWGSWNDEQNPWCDEEYADPIYNTGLLIENCYFHEMDAEAVVVGICDGALVTHCRSINCCQGEGVDENGKVLYFTAAMWFWGSENSTIEYCEIAGQKNVGDGMTVDFDSQTNNCTYQYIYSHDNVRFMVNNAKTSPQQNNTVRYCLSVNDNKGRSSIASGAGENNFRFYNNTIVNCGDFHLFHLTNSLFVNNIIMPEAGAAIAYDIPEECKAGNTYSNNCYYRTVIPAIDLRSQYVSPGFVGGSGAEAYQLFEDSPLIGTGYPMQDGLILDFFGNRITGSHIGCYAGDGVKTEKGERISFLEMLEKILCFFENLLNALQP